MKSRSSTFNSESLRLGGLRPYGLALAFGILALIELTVPRSTELWTWSPRSHVGVFEYLEHELIGQDDFAPQVLLLGSSRMRDAVAPLQLAQELGLDSGRVVNLGLTGGTPFDALAFYERNRARLSSAEIVLVGVEDWYVNVAIPATQRERRYAGLRERLGIYAPEEERRLVLGALWRTYDARTAIVEYFSRTAPEWREPPGLTPGGRLVWREEETWTGPDAVDIGTQIATSYRDFRSGDGRFRRIERLAELVREDGTQLVVVQIPWRDSYVDAVTREQTGPFAAYEHHLLQTKRAVGDETPGFPSRGSELGIPATCYYDYGHMTGCGTEIFTRNLAAQLAPLLAGPASPSPE